MTALYCARFRIARFRTPWNGFDCRAFTRSRATALHSALAAISVGDAACAAKSGGRTAALGVLSAHAAATTAIAAVANERIVFDDIVGLSR